MVSLAAAASVAGHPGGTAVSDNKPWTADQVIWALMLVMMTMCAACLLVISIVFLVREL